MHCLTCNKQNSADQRFCRYCGTSLREVSASSIDLPARGVSETPASKVTTRMAARRMDRMIFWGLIIICVGVTLLANAQDYALVNGLGILVFFAGIGLAMYGAFRPAKTKAAAAGESSGQKNLDPSEPRSYLPPKDFSEPVPSVTERTTDLLEIENKRKP